MKARLQRNTRGSGSLTFYFSTDEQLQVLYERIVSSQRALLDGAGGNGYSITPIEVAHGLLDESFDLDFDDGNEEDTGH